MHYLNFDLEIAPRSGGVYAVSTRSQAGEKTETIRFPFDEHRLRERRKDLQIALLQSLISARQVLSPEQQVVQSFGKQLFETLMVGDIRSRYDLCRQMAASEQAETGVRLRLDIRPPELVALPWEFLYDERKGEYICLSRYTTLIRYTGLTQPIQPLTVAPPLHILGMIATPADRAQLDTSREQERLTEALGDLEKQGVVKLHWLAGQTWRDLQQALWHGPWHIFHFIGHGSFDSGSQEGILALADEAGKTQIFRAAQLSRLLADHPSLRLVLLNACEGARSDGRDVFSSTAATLARGGIPAVLAMQYAISDHAAIRLTQTFYEALADGQAVDEAVAEARKAISFAASRTLEWGTPVLYLRSTDGTLFRLPQTGRQRRAEKAQPEKQLERVHAATQPQQKRAPLVVPLGPAQQEWSAGAEIVIRGRMYMLHDEAGAHIEQQHGSDRSYLRRRAKAWRQDLDRLVWLKQVQVLRQTPLAKQALEALRTEKHLLAKLEHLPDFPHVLDVEESDQGYMLVFTFTPGTPLGRAFGPLDTPLEPSRIVDLLRCLHPLYAMLDALHRQRVAHRNLSPEQIVVVGGRNVRAVVGDLGLAAAPLTADEGPPLYRAPEQVRGFLPTASVAQIDIYQLGAVLYHLIVGQPVLNVLGHIEPPGIFNRSVSPGLDATLLRALASTPAERWPNIFTFRNALNQASN
jgi:hypothetical protein